MNWGKVGDAIGKHFDTDICDIQREVSGKLETVYANIPCHIAIKQSDNPDPTSVDVTPIILSLAIHMPLYVDIENNDYVIAKRLSNTKEVLEQYAGRVGSPAVSQGRKMVNMQMQADTEKEPVETLVTIQVQYKDGETELQPMTTDTAKKGEMWSMTAPFINGYNAVSVIVDGMESASTKAIIPVVEEAHAVTFIYEVGSVETYLRLLFNSTYTKDDGAITSGYHLYKKMNYEVVEVVGNITTIKLDTNRVIHDDTGLPLVIGVGVKMKLYNGQWVQVMTDGVKVADGYTYGIMDYTPTEEEASAYTTSWYDG